MSRRRRTVIRIINIVICRSRHGRRTVIIIVAIILIRACSTNLNPCVNVGATGSSVSLRVGEHSGLGMKFSRYPIRIRLQGRNQRMKSVAGKRSFEIRKAKLASDFCFGNRVRFGRFLPKWIRFWISGEHIGADLKRFRTRIDRICVDGASRRRNAANNILREDGTTADDAHWVIHSERHFFVGLIGGQR